MNGEARWSTPFCSAALHTFGSLLRNGTARFAFPVIPKEHTKLSPGMAPTRINTKQGQTPARAQVCALSTL